MGKRWPESGGGCDDRNNIGFFVVLLVNGGDAGG
jgi:hypothetical protein